MIATMKNSEIPPYIESPPPPGNEKDPSQPSKDAVRIRGDLSGSILEQLTMPLQDFTLSMPLVVENSNDNAGKATTMNEGTGNDVHSDVKVGTLERVESWPRGQDDDDDDMFVIIVGCVTSNGCVFAIF